MEEEVPLTEDEYRRRFHDLQKLQKVQSFELKELDQTADFSTHKLKLILNHSTIFHDSLLKLLVDFKTALDAARAADTKQKFSKKRFDDLIAQKPELEAKQEDAIFKGRWDKKLIILQKQIDPARLSIENTGPN